ncbi:MAG: ribosome biogenesis GTP-binding protein YihA/YsxC [Pseudomonadota bacterium]
MKPKVSPPARLVAEFLRSAPNLRGCPVDDRPEVAFAGRSNAGKSSVLNRITGNKHLAKVSKTPGRTQLLNLFDVQAGGRLVDLPGYGYAKAGKQAQREWQKSVNDYLSRRDNLAGVILVMDIRHPNQSFDTELIEWAQASEMPIRALLNKADKLSFSKRKQALGAFRKHYAGHEMLSTQVFSAANGEGLDELFAQLSTWLGHRTQDAGSQAHPDTD